MHRFWPFGVLEMHATRLPSIDRHLLRYGASPLFWRLSAFSLSVLESQEIDIRLLDISGALQCDEDIHCTSHALFDKRSIEETKTRRPHFDLISVPPTYTSVLRLCFSSMTERKPAAFPSTLRDVYLMVPSGPRPSTLPW